MGYQEALFKTKKERMEALENFIELNKEEVENPPIEHCSIPSTITFKQNVMGHTVYGTPSRMFKEGEKYFWAVGERAGVQWLPELLESYGFVTEDYHIEDVPSFAFEGFKEFMQKWAEEPNRPPFENDYVIIEQVNYI